MDQQSRRWRCNPMARIVRASKPKPRPKPKVKQSKPAIASRIVRYGRYANLRDLPEPPSGNPVWDELMRRVRETMGIKNGTRRDALRTCRGVSNPPALSTFTGLPAGRTVHPVRGYHHADLTTRPPWGGLLYCKVMFALRKFNLSVGSAVRNHLYAHASETLSRSPSEDRYISDETEAAPRGGFLLCPQAKGISAVPVLFL
jgi:hypothetical protein